MGLRGASLRKAVHRVIDRLAKAGSLEARTSTSFGQTVRYVRCLGTLTGRVRGVSLSLPPCPWHRFRMRRILSCLAPKSNLCHPWPRSQREAATIVTTNQEESNQCHRTNLRGLSGWRLTRYPSISHGWRKVSAGRHGIGESKPGALALLLYWCLSQAKKDVSR
jgi:hypothetical protein